MDTITRQMRGCPYACPGYTPKPLYERPEQEVPILGGEWHRGYVCPGSLVAEDPLVREVIGDYRTLRDFCQGNSLKWWRKQPAWWTTAMGIVQSMKDTIEAEALKGDA